MTNRILAFLGAFICSITFVNSQTPCLNGMAGPYPCENVDLISTISLEDLGGVQNMNDIWGWTDVESGREFAIVGLRNGTSFVEVTDPMNPLVIGQLPTETYNSLWRDVKVYNNYAFIVSEADDHGMQIFDLTRLLMPFIETPVTFDQDAYYDNFGSAHNIVINEESGYAYGVGTGTFGGGLHFINIQDPLSPTIAGGYDGDGYTHDAQVVIYNGPDWDYVGHELAFCSNEDAVTIVDVTNKLDPQLISTFSYSDAGYTHQGWLTDDRNFFVFNDELDELYELTDATKTLFLDIKDLDNPSLHYEHLSTSPSIDHNLYNKGSLCYQSNYTSGLRILDLGNIPEHDISQVGFFDSQPDNDAVQFSGTWSNYVYFPSGIVIMTDMYSNFFILQPNLINAYRYVETCGNDSQVEFYIDVTYSEDITEAGSTDFLPNNMTVEIGELSAPGQIPITVNFLDVIEAGTYEIPVSLGNEGGALFTEMLKIVVVDTPEITVTGMNPENNFSGEVPAVYLSWDYEIGTQPYMLTIANDPDFNDIVYSEFVENNGYSFEGSGMYYWKLSLPNSCGTFSDSEVFSFENTTVGVEEYDSGIAVYPNPVQGLLTISGVSGIIDVVSIDGKLVKSLTINNQVTTDVSELAKGIYILNVRGTAYYSRFIKE